ncbi:hypothetical protein OQA88_10578 [Cercophora sp. LCS_1]
MTRLALQIAPPTTKLQLYRHLLREASYLPPFARPYIGSIIKQRFRHKLKEEPTESRLRSARRSLRQLRAANHGDLECMRRVVMLVFGRTGQRRRILMEHYLTRLPSADEKEKEEAHKGGLQRALDGRPLDWLDRWDMDKLQALVRSQAKAVETDSPRTQLKAKEIDADKSIPKETCWGRPLTKKATRNKVLKQWKRILDKLLPPMPKDEWELLGDLARGKEIDKQWAEPRRRPVARSPGGGGAFSGFLDWNWQAYATRPIARVDRQGSRRLKLRSGVVDDNPPGGDPVPLGKHKLGPHLWRRLMARVWRLSAFMEPEPSKKGWQHWKFTWGEKSFEPTTSTAGAAFFRTLPETAPGRSRGGKSI